MSDEQPPGNEFDRFGRGRSPAEYKREELANVEKLADESDVEQERKRMVYLGLMLQAEEQGNPHGLVEFNRERFDRISTIIQRRRRKREIRNSLAIWISALALVVAVISLLSQFL